MGLFRKPNPKPIPPEWIAVYITNSIEEAHIVAGRLQSEEIQSFIHKEPGAGAIGITIGTFGEVKILVRSEDYEKAIRILDPELTDELPENTDQIIYHWEENDYDDE